MRINGHKQLAAAAFHTGVIGLLSISSVYGAAIPVPDGSFTSGGGSVGGGLLAVSGSQVIGGGP